MRVTVALVVLLACLPSAFAGPIAVASYEWSIVGEVVDVLEIPSSGGAYSVTVERSKPTAPAGTEFLQIICDANQPASADCARLSLGSIVEFHGFVLSNEPNTGQRLSAVEVVNRVP